MFGCSSYQLLVYLSCAACIGFDKGGIPGVAAFGLSMVITYGGDHRIGETLALFVPVLFTADLGAALSYRKHVDWKALQPLWIPCLFGILLGVCSLGSLPEWAIKKLSGLSLLILAVIHFSGKRNSKALPQHADSGILWNTCKLRRPLILKDAEVISNFIFGGLIGFFTVIANIAGPILVIYLLKLEIPKMQMNGTRAWFFIIINCIKIPVQVRLGNLGMTQLHLLVPLVATGILATIVSAEVIATRIDQKRFEQASWSFVVVGALKLLLSL